MNSPRPGDTYTMDQDVIRVVAVTETSVLVEREMTHSKFTELASAALRHGAVLKTSEPEEFEV